MTDEQRDNLLLAMSKNLECLNEKIDSKYESLNKKFDDKYDSLNAKVEQYHKEALENHQTLVNILEKQRLSIVKLEYDLTDQIRALFDISDINNDKFREHDAAIKEIQKRMDWHNRRLLKLETAN